MRSVAEELLEAVEAVLPSPFINAVEFLSIRVVLQTTTCQSISELGGSQLDEVALRICPFTKRTANWLRGDHTQLGSMQHKQAAV